MPPANPTLRIPCLAAGRVRWTLPPRGWHGVRVTTQAEADELVPKLLATDASVRFVLATPREALSFIKERGPRNMAEARKWGDGVPTMPFDWLIVAGETGRDARPLHPQWVRELRDQAAGAGVPFFFSSWGRWTPEAPMKRGVWDFSRQHTMATDGTLYGPGDLAYPSGPRRGEAFRAGHDKGNLVSMYRVGSRAAGRLLDGVEHTGTVEGWK